MNRAIVAMGVSGSGKSTLGRALATALGWTFVEGDALHSEANIRKMSAGTPLDDEDRRPWLEKIGQAVLDHRSAGVVVTCSALKRRYRDLIRARAGDVTFVMAMLDIETIRARMSKRQGHFMPPTLLDSQFAALEQLGKDEDAIVVDGMLDTEAQVVNVLGALEARDKDSRSPQSPGGWNQEGR